MEKTITIRPFYMLLVYMLLALPCFARDYIVEFEDENYREEQKSFSYSPIIYHSIQVRSSAGPKLLILTGDNYHYRKWLRHYIAQGKAFIVKVPEEQIDQFITASAFDIDITFLHPFDLEQYKKGEAKSLQMKDRSGTTKKSDKSMGAPMRQMSDRTKAIKAKANKDQAAKNQADREAVIQKKADQQKNRADALDKDRKKQLDKQLEQRQLENEKLLKALAEQKSLEEKRAQEQEALFAALSEQRAREERLRRQELEQRWQELKQRLLQDERIRNLEIDVRNREIQTRWLELQQSLNL
ncbi:MAG: hypothetical protein ABIJ59_10800 [Pseudomonadota bacterium]